ncbi:MAG: hypothetical protein ABII71_02230 [Candidatus Micrarchaeota archaeon]
MLFEMIVQTFLGILAVYFSLILLGTRKPWKMILGIVLMAGGLAFTLDAGEFLMWLLGYVPAMGVVKSFLASAFPIVVAGSFLAWLAYVFLAYISRLSTLRILWAAFTSKAPSRADHLEAAKNNALKDQFFWLVASFVVVLIGLIISIQIWTRIDTFYTNSSVLIIALVWAYVIPPLVIHTWLRKPDEINALKELKNFQGLPVNKISDYKELIAVMDEIKDERLKLRLDEIIVDGLSKALIDSSDSKSQKPEAKKPKPENR